MKVLKGLAITVGIVLALLLLFVGIVLEWPSWVVNEKSLQWARETFNERGEAKVTWSEARIESEDTGFLANSLRFRLKDFCYRKEPNFESCFASVLVSFSYDGSALPPKLTRLGPFEALGGRLTSVSTEEEKKPTSLELQMPSWLADARLEPVTVVIEEYTLRSAQGERKGNLRVTTQGATYRLALQDKEATIRGNATSTSDKAGGPWNLSGTARLTPEKGKALNASFSFLGAEKTGKARAESVNPPGTVACDLNVSEEEPVVNADCAMEAFVPRVKEEMGGALHARLEMSEPLNTGEVMDLRLRFTPRDGLGLDSEGQLAAHVRFIPMNLPELEDLSASVDLSVEAKNFQEVVALLKDSPYPVPSPLRVLHGKLRFTAKGNLDENGGVVNTNFESRLASQNQRVYTNGTGRVNVALEDMKPEKILANLDLVLEDVQLVLPPVGVSPPPRLMPDQRIDPRFGARPKPKKEPGLVEYTARVHTEKPLRLITDVTADPVPLEFDLRTTGEESLRGTLAIQDFGFDVLGIERDFEGAQVFVRASERQMQVTGEAEVPAQRDEEEIFYAPKPGEPLAFPTPQIPLALSEILTGLGVGYPVALTVVEETRGREEIGTREEGKRLEARRRW